MYVATGALEVCEVASSLVDCIYIFQNHSLNHAQSAPSFAAPETRLRRHLSLLSNRFELSLSLAGVPGALYSRSQCKVDRWPAILRCDFCRCYASKISFDCKGAFKVRDLPQPLAFFDHPLQSFSPSLAEADCTRHRMQGSHLQHSAYRPRQQHDWLWQAL